jgi:protein-L-isoaspartate(D-aspartate) O-methyltransferase
MRRALALAAALGLSGGCSRTEPASRADRGAEPIPPAAETAGPEGQVELADRTALARDQMVREQIAARGIESPAVLAAMRAVPRHELVPKPVRELAYADRPLPIGYDQTISQPYIVALMTELSAAGPGDKVLEIGTGSGYQAAVLAELGARVFSIEIVEPLAVRAGRDLERLGHGDKVTVRAGDGYRGWPAEAPFDAILLTAAPPKVPQPLIEQLRVGGRLVAPVGEGIQELRVLRKTESGVTEEAILPVQFVPMTGEARDGR